jgi:acyl-CoA reductase-like NAD-dependent aldehyde dehydrogenase
VKEKLFIYGQYVDSKGGASFEVINPANEISIWKGVIATNEDVDFAAESARKAF